MESKIIHTFIVLAYKESEYLEEAIRSVLKQDYPSKVVIGTSTDNAYIRSLAEKYHLEVIVNPIKNGNNIGDFDFAWKAGRNEIVTIAHQDDIYDPGYSKAIVEAYRKYPESEIIFTDYYEIRGDKKVYHNHLLNVKKALLFPLKCMHSAKSIFWKQSAIRFGTAICCPAVSYIRKNIPFDSIFQQSEFIGVGDWYGWYKLSLVKGKAFTLISQPLMGHRVHEGSHTSREIHNNIRSKQEIEMFRKFWPEWIAQILNHYYRHAQYSNDIK
jgi:glycosyltransferase involved in cell wall biosynthesis